MNDEKGGEQKRGRPGKGRDKPQETVTEPQPIWGMSYADDAGIVSRSRNSLAKMADIVAVCASFGLTVSLAKTETMCLMTKRMDRVTFVTEAAGQVYKQSLCTLGKLCAINTMLTLPLRSTGECCWPAYVSDGMVCHCTTSPPHRSGSKSGCSKLR